MFTHETKTETVDQDAFRKQLCVQIAADIYRSGYYGTPEVVGKKAVETLQVIEKGLRDEKKDKSRTHGYSGLE